MNHLAHLFLAGDSVESLIGNLSGDFVKGVLRDEHEPAIRAGIVAHRRIDEFTDTHAAVARFRGVIAPEYGHYSRVIADMFLDHFLACDFSLYSNETLERFLMKRFATLDPHIARMPERLQIVYPRLRDEGWLLSYREIRGIHEALYWMSRRFSRQPRLERATSFLTHQRAELHSHFSAFLPDVITFAHSLH
jgi:acyl carrier protein phosphodiesterase